MELTAEARREAVAQGVGERDRRGLGGAVVGHRDGVGVRRPWLHRVDAVGDADRDVGGGITSTVAMAEAAVSWSLVANTEVTSDSMATGASVVSV